MAASVPWNVTTPLIERSPISEPKASRNAVIRRDTWAVLASVLLPESVPSKVTAPLIERSLLRVPCALRVATRLRATCVVAESAPTPASVPLKVTTPDGAAVPTQGRVERVTILG